MFGITSPIEMATTDAGCAAVATKGRSVYALLTQDKEWIVIEEARTESDADAETENLDTEIDNGLSTELNKCGELLDLPTTFSATRHDDIYCDTDTTDTKLSVSTIKIETDCTDTCTNNYSCETFGAGVISQGDTLCTSSTNVCAEASRHVKTEQISNETESSLLHREENRTLRIKTEPPDISYAADYYLNEQHTSSVMETQDILSCRLPASCVPSGQSLDQFGRHFHQTFDSLSSVPYFRGGSMMTHNEQRFYECNCLTNTYNGCWSCTCNGCYFHMSDERNFCADYRAVEPPFRSCTLYSQCNQSFFSNACFSSPPLQTTWKLHGSDELGVCSWNIPSYVESEPNDFRCAWNSPDLPASDGRMYTVPGLSRVNYVCDGSRVCITNTDGLYERGDLVGNQSGRKRIVQAHANRSRHNVKRSRFLGRRSRENVHKKRTPVFKASRRKIRTKNVYLLNNSAKTDCVFCLGHPKNYGNRLRKHPITRPKFKMPCWRCFMAFSRDNTSGEADFSEVLVQAGLLYIQSGTKVPHALSSSKHNMTTSGQEQSSNGVPVEETSHRGATTGRALLNPYVYIANLDCSPMASKPQSRTEHVKCKINSQRLEFNINSKSTTSRAINGSNDNVALSVEQDHGRRSLQRNTDVVNKTSVSHTSLPTSYNRTAMPTARRGKRCRVCTGCKSASCGQCKYCLDLRRYGGPGMTKQACILRRCSNRKRKNAIKASQLQPVLDNPHPGIDPAQEMQSKDQSGTIWTPARVAGPTSDARDVENQVEDATQAPEHCNCQPGRIFPCRACIVMSCRRAERDLDSAADFSREIHDQLAGKTGTTSKQKQSNTEAAEKVRKSQKAKRRSKLKNGTDRRHEAWARPVRRLWQDTPTDLNAERSFNLASALSAPHCSVCSLFEELKVVCSFPCKGCIRQSVKAGTNNGSHTVDGDFSSYIREMFADESVAHGNGDVRPKQKLDELFRHCGQDRLRPTMMSDELLGAVSGGFHVDSNNNSNQTEAERGPATVGTGDTFSCFLSSVEKVSSACIAGCKSRLPLRTVPYVPGTCFAKGDKSAGLGAEEEEGPSTLLMCSVCCVCVHTSCYGADKDLSGDDGKWTCDRCRSEQPSACCCLCNLRGGALKSTTDGRLAHIVCALAIPEVTFTDIIKRGPVDVSNIECARLELNCCYCGLDGKVGNPMACVQCSHGRCAVSFHVTCGHVAGVTYEASDWPLTVYVSCKPHESIHKRKGKATFSNQPLNPGERVYAQHQNRLYYPATVEAAEGQTFYEVVFDEEGTMCSDLYPSDIQGHRTGDGVPEVGIQVKVTWKGDVYDATFSGSNTQLLYQVKFEDGSCRKLERKYMWRTTDHLPPRVQNRLGHISERKANFIDDSADSLPTESREITDDDGNVKCLRLLKQISYPQ